MFLTTPRPIQLVAAFIAIASHASLVSPSHSKDPPKQPWKPEKVLATAKLSTQAHMLLVPVNIDGKEFQFALETDEYYSRIDRSLAHGLRRFTYRELKYTADEMEKLGKELDDYSPACKAPKLRIGNYQPDFEQGVVPGNIVGASSREGYELHGTLCMDVLQHLILHIDPENDLLILCGPSEPTPPPGKSTWLYLGANKTPYVNIVVTDKVTENFKISTGNYVDSGEISASLLNKGGVRAVTKLLSQDPETDDDGEPIVTEFYKLASLTTAGVQTQNLSFRKGTQNCLGANFLLRHRITLDFNNERLYAEATRFTAARDRLSQDGISWGSGVVKGVEPDSNAAQAGIKPGDRVVAINGTDVSNSMFTYRALSTPSDQPLVLDLERDGKALKIELP